MRVQITGIGSKEYETNGIIKRSKTLYFTKLDNVEDVDGLMTGNEYIGGDSEFYKLPFKVGQVLNILYDKAERYDKDTKQRINVAVVGAILDEHFKPLA